MHIFEITSIASLVTLVGLVGGQARPLHASAAPAPAAINSQPTAPLETAVAVDDFPVASAKAVVSGAMKFKGDVPAPKMLRVQGDETCEALHPEPPINESLLVSKDGQIQNVFVYIKKGVEQWKHAVPETPVTLTQEGCMYKPHVFGIMVGQELEISNGDDTTHNVHLFAIKNTSFNMTQKKDSKAKKKFSTAEVMVEFKCDIHSWMGSRVGVLDHPFYAVSAADGSFSLPKLPAGSYTVEAIHEELGKQSQEITVVDAVDLSIEFTFEAKKKKSRRRKR
ncbi:MAG: carboxypeptidase regulatory-like domain-containing protein [Planctomycetota bacterium]|nr:carboxypeptidase regulatory-like domain-containing protein [Planctomycetota bacterium]